tara:strand:+ start:597 stop:1769 length:1173 start_codon:yes stop_codon:yes gene_type:complete
MKKLILLIILMAMSCPSFSEYDDHHSGFQQGMDAYQSGDFEGAVEVWSVLSYPGIFDWLDANVMSQYELGRMYLYGIGVEKDIEKGLDLIMESARADYSKSQFLIGLLYEEGKLLKQSKKNAIKWINKAALKGNSDAIEWMLPDFDLKENVIPKLSYGKYYALVIGNDNYQELKNLQNAVNDANDVATLLKSSYGFAVDILINANREEILNAFSKIRKQATKKDNILIYYAGHGWRYDTNDDEGFWLPVDSSMNNEFNWIPNTDIIRSVNRMKAKHVIVVADSCFSGTMTRSVKIAKKNSNFIEKIVNKKARTVLTSGGLEPVSDVGGDSNSVFASAFLSILSENQGVIDGSNLFNILRDKVVTNSDQTPEYGNIRKTGHDGGDFLFVRQ